MCRYWENVRPWNNGIPARSPNGTGSGGDRPLMTMTPATQTILTSRGVPAEAAAGVLKCDGRRSVASGSQTHVRIAENVAEQGAQRIGTMAILTAVTVVATSILQHALQPELVAAE